MDWNNIAHTIGDQLGEPFVLERYSGVGGGCINSAYRLQGNGKSFFIKLNSADRLDMFEAEADGLTEMAAAHAIRVPLPVCSGIEGNQAYLVMEYIETGGGAAGVMQQFGQQLANMHRYSSERFGWHRDNTIGSTTQINDWADNWLDFWREHRLGFQLQLAASNGAGRSLQTKGEQLMQQMHMLFSDYQPLASILHGDLWSGNYAISQNGEPVIFDPAVYYGDREADLAMTELFGGFSHDFYAAYDASWPIDPGYKVRKTFYNLYHILNHFNLFGGGYASQAQGMIERLLSELN